MLFSSLPNFLSGVSLFFYFEIYNYSQWKKTWIIQQPIVVPFCAFWQSRDLVSRFVIYLPKKIYEFRYMFVNSEIDVICVSETWFVQSLCDVLISCDGYNVYRSDRVSHGGWVPIYVKKKFKI